MNMPRGVFKWYHTVFNCDTACAVMWKTIVWGSVLAGVIVVIHSSDDIIGEGKWLVNSVQQCPDPEQYPIDIVLKKRKIDRTKDAFYCKMNLPEIIEEHTIGVHVELYKKCDGGYKFQQNFDYGSFCKLITDYAEENKQKALSSAGLDPPDCPIPQGVLEIEDFIFNYDELPSKGMLGEFQAKAFLTQGGLPVGCLIMELTFAPNDVTDDE